MILAGDADKTLLYIWEENANDRNYRSEFCLWVDVLVFSVKKQMQWKKMHVSLCVQLRGQRRNMTRRSVDAKPKSASAEDEPATNQTESAALQDLTDEVKLNTMTKQEAIVFC